MPSLATRAPTLAIDHLIVSNKFERVAIFHPPLMDTSVGYLPKSISGDKNLLGMPMELYMSGDVLFLQLRSTLKFAKKKKFV